MERYFTQTIGLPILTETGHKVGRVYDVILNTDTGKVVGFLTSAKGTHVVAPIDVLIWTNKLVIRDQEDILETDEIHQVREALKKNNRIFHAKVITKSGHYIGKVFDFAMHEKFFILTKIFVAKSFLGIFQYDRKIFPHKDILEIRRDAIVIRDPIAIIPVKTLKKLRIDVAPTT